MVSVFIFTQSLFACRRYDFIIVYKIPLAAGFIEDMQNVDKSVENNIADLKLNVRCLHRKEKQ